MSNGYINSNQITAHSSFNDVYLPFHGRLFSSVAWCGESGTYLEEYKLQWFQVRFTQNTRINGMAIQGDPNYYQNFIRRFKLQFSTNGTNWHKFDYGKEFTANVDNINVVYNWFTTPMIATYVRLYATLIERHNDSIAQPCLRVEFFGCSKSNTFLPLGMSTSIIKNSQLTQSTGANATAARLFYPGIGLYKQSTFPMYLQVDFVTIKAVTGISMEGVYQAFKKHFVKTYKLSYSNDSINFIRSNQVFKENTEVSAVFIPLWQPTLMKNMRITAISCAGHCSMKVEIYGYDLECSQIMNLSISVNNGASRTNMNIDSPTTWCLKGISDYVNVTFNKPIVISGIVLQGDSNTDGWVKTYKVQYGVRKNRFLENLIGVSERIFPLSVNWLNPHVVTSYLYIIATSCNHNKCCLRFQLKGCQLDLKKPHSIKASLSSSTITFTWKASTSQPLSVKYHLAISASKDYEHKHNFSFQTINTTTSALSFNVFNVNVAAARVQINITADIQGVTESAAPFNFYIQPKKPPPPGFTKINCLNETNNITSITLYRNITCITLTSSSDSNGPISYYEIVISTTRKSNLPTQLKKQKESELKNLDYFLAAMVYADDLSPDGIKYYFVEGKEYVDGLNARISTMEKYYLYARAVIYGNDISKHGFDNISYFGNLTQVTIERDSLKLLVPEIFVRNKTSVKLVKGPSNLRYMYIVIMKINRTVWQEKEPLLYKQINLKTYETADYDEPYIAGVFNKRQLLTVGDFVLGDNSTYTVSTSHAWKTNLVTEYRNGPLVDGETYAVFQRIQVKDVLSSTRWSRLFVYHSNSPTNYSPPSSNLLLIIGISVGAVTVLVILAIVVFVRFRKYTISNIEEIDSDSKGNSIQSKHKNDIVLNYRNLVKNDQDKLQECCKEVDVDVKNYIYYQDMEIKVQDCNHQNHDNADLQKHGDYYEVKNVDQSNIYENAVMEVEYESCEDFVSHSLTNKECYEEVDIADKSDVYYQHMNIQDGEYQDLIASDLNNQEYYKEFHLAEKHDNYYQDMGIKIQEAQYQDLVDSDLNNQESYKELENCKNRVHYEDMTLTAQHEPMDKVEFSKFFTMQSNCDFEEIKKQIDLSIKNYEYFYFQDDATAVNEVTEIPSDDGQIGYSIFQHVQTDNSPDMWKIVFQKKFQIVVLIKPYDVLRSRKILDFSVGESRKHGNYNIYLHETKVLSDHTIEEVEILYGKLKHRFCLYEIMALPLKEYIDATEYLMNICRSLKQTALTSSKTKISFIDISGCGFDIILIIVIQNLIRMKKEENIDIYNTFNMIIRKVPLLNVCFEQYLLIHKVVWEIITHGNKYVLLRKLKEECNKGKKDIKGRCVIEKEFKELIDLQKSIKTTLIASSSPSNVSKNRFPEIVACDRKRVILSQRSDYINAVYVDSYEKRNAFIATQAPLKETVLDFWNMVAKENVTSIVMLYNFNEGKDAEYPVIWLVPNDNLEGISVKLVSEASHGVILLRYFLLTLKQVKRYVNIFQLTNWSLTKLPSVKNVISLIGELEKSQERLGGGTVVVTCSDGAYRTGTFIACKNALDQLKLEKGVDVFNILRCIRQSRPEFVLNKHQYGFIYEVVSTMF
ncbi:uncharacterized protein LOC130655137 isoform X2 [Hydractinia symbiolongicarpus]|uniref:uncharacterized protein LOC130655137 isoform X2 n=1 Tax=Hydractinia symbiolongicarpus TaxID=13093 RepID=UPI00254BE3A9|nr:uncharacterized protein LOC130655137 isoform X2 [Hydractinia symbiolongicarpus]